MSADIPDLTSRGTSGGVLSKEYRWTSIGMCALILLSAFESLAVTTIMPGVSKALDGESLYALAFAGPLAVSVVGMVLAGNWADRRGPRAAVLGGVLAFTIGLIVAGTAQSMDVFVAGRLIHGFGGGALVVAMYVIVARVYPHDLQPRIFAGFAAAWVVPSLIGPLIAGLVADAFSWHWVFLGVVVLIVPALAMMTPALRGLGEAPTAIAPPWSFSRIAWATLAAVAVLGLNLSSGLGASTGVGEWVGWVAAVVAIAVIAWAVRPLLPAGTLRGAPGLPSVVLLRGLVAGSFFSAEIYMPYLLSSHYGLSASMAGLALTLGGVSWGVASQIQGRYAVKLSHQRCFRIGSAMLGFALAVTIAAPLLEMPPWVLIVGWGVAGAGMGIMYPRTSVMALQSSTAENQGFVSSAISISDAIGSAVAIALAGIVFVSIASLGGVWPFVGCFLLAAALWALALGVGRRAVIVPASLGVVADGGGAAPATGVAPAA